jgi:hypothetical protein
MFAAKPKGKKNGKPLLTSNPVRGKNVGIRVQHHARVATYTYSK